MMLHHFMTTELVRQRRAALDAEAHDQRVVRNSSRTHPDPGRGRFAATARMVARQVRGLVAAPPPEPATHGGRHDHPPRAK
jgi:hypothetical protein